MVEQATDGSGDHDALDAVADFVKVTTSLAVGALVFGVGLITAATTPTWAGRFVALLAVLALFGSAIYGAFAHSRIPVLISNCEYSIRDEKLSQAGQKHQIALMVGLLLLAVVLALNVFATPPAATLAVPDAASALVLAKKHVPSKSHIKKVDVVELVRGADTANPALDEWHVRFVETKGAKSNEIYQDLYIGATNALITQ